MVGQYFLNAKCKVQNAELRIGSAYDRIYNNYSSVFAEQYIIGAKRPFVLHSAF